MPPTGAQADAFGAKIRKSLARSLTSAGSDTAAAELCSLIAALSANEGDDIHDALGESIGADLLHSFLKPSNNPLSRRWIGLLLCVICQKSKSTAKLLCDHNSNARGDLQGLGSMVVGREESEDLRLVSGMLIRDIACHGVEIGIEWPVEVSSVAFTESQPHEWIFRLQDFINKVFPERRTKSGIGFPTEFQAEEMYFDSQKAPMIMFIESGLTVVVPPPAAPYTTCIDIPFENIAGAHLSSEFAVTLDLTAGATSRTFVVNAKPHKRKQADFQFRSPGEAKRILECIEGSRGEFQADAQPYSSQRVSERSGIMEASPDAPSTNGAMQALRDRRSRTKMGVRSQRLGAGGPELSAPSLEETKNKKKENGNDFPSAAAPHPSHADAMRETARLQNEADDGEDLYGLSPHGHASQQRLAQAPQKGRKPDSQMENNRPPGTKRGEYDDHVHVATSHDQMKSTIGGVRATKSSRKPGPGKEQSSGDAKHHELPKSQKKVKSKTGKSKTPTVSKAKTLDDASIYDLDEDIHSSTPSEQEQMTKGRVKRGVGRPKQEDDDFKPPQQLKTQKKTTGRTTRAAASRKVASTESGDQEDAGGHQGAKKATKQPQEHTSGYLLRAKHQDVHHESKMRSQMNQEPQDSRSDKEEPRSRVAQGKQPTDQRWERLGRPKRTAKQESPDRDERNGDRESAGVSPQEENGINNSRAPGRAKEPSKKGHLSNNLPSAIGDSQENAMVIDSGDESSSYHSLSEANGPNREGEHTKRQISVKKPATSTVVVKRERDDTPALPPSSKKERSADSRKNRDSKVSSTKLIAENNDGEQAGDENGLPRKPTIIHFDRHGVRNQGRPPPAKTPVRETPLQNYSTGRSKRKQQDDVFGSLVADMETSQAEPRSATKRGAEAELDHGQVKRRSKSPLDEFEHLFEPGRRTAHSRTQPHAKKQSEQHVESPHVRAGSKRTEHPKEDLPPLIYKQARDRTPRPTNIQSPINPKSYDDDDFTHGDTETVHVDQDTVELPEISDASCDPPEPLSSPPREVNQIVPHSPSTDNHVHTVARQNSAGTSRVPPDTKYNSDMDKINMAPAVSMMKGDEQRDSNDAATAQLQSQHPTGQIPAIQKPSTAAENGRGIRENEPRMQRWMSIVSLEGSPRPSETLTEKEPESLDRVRSAPAQEFGAAEPLNDVPQSLRRPQPMRRISSNGKRLPEPPEAESKAITTHIPQSMLNTSKVLQTPANPPTDPFASSCPTPEKAKDETHFLRKLRAQMTSRTAGCSNKAENSHGASPYQEDKVADEDDPDRTLVDLVDEDGEMDYSDGESATAESSMVEDTSEELTEEMEWEASLKPCHRDMIEELTRISRHFIRHLIDSETAIEDIIADYERDGTRLIEQMEKSHRKEYEAQRSTLSDTRTHMSDTFRHINKQITSRDKQVRAGLIENEFGRRSTTSRKYISQLESLLAGMDGYDQ